MRRARAPASKFTKLAVDGIRPKLMMRPQSVFRFLFLYLLSPVLAAVVSVAEKADEEVEQKRPFLPPGRGALQSAQRQIVMA
jgi:hypothetical protein